jgi:hypothetical protein
MAPLIGGELMLIDGAGHGVYEQACMEVNQKLERLFLSARYPSTIYPF